MRQIHLLASEWPELAAAAGVKRKRGTRALAENDKPTAADLFAEQLGLFRGLTFEREYRFATQIGRNWRFDFAFREYHLGVEIDGVNVRRIGGELIVQGRHATITGIRGDNEKLNTATRLGWSVLRFLQSDVKPRHAIEFTLRVLEERGWKPQRGVQT